MPKGRSLLLAIVVILLIKATVLTKLLISVQASGAATTKPIIGQCNYTLYEFETITDAINRALTFLNENIEGIILDTAMGTRTLEGEFQWSLIDALNQNFDYSYQEFNV